MMYIKEISGGFFEKQRTRRGAIFTADPLKRAQEFLDEGRELS